MNKRIAIAAHERKSTQYYCEQLKALFKDNVDIELYSVEDRSISNINADIVLVSTHSIYEEVKRQVSNCGDIIIADITLKKHALEKIMSIPENTKVLLVNINAEMAIDTIALIYQYGVAHIDFVPYYPGKEIAPDVNIAVTPGEAKLVPKNISEIIDLGHRVLSVKTIVDIAIKLGLDYLLQTYDFVNYFESLVENSYGIESLLGKTNVLEKQLDLMLQILDEGIIGLNSNGVICFLNDAAEKIIGTIKENAIGKYYEEIIGDLSFTEVMKTRKPVKRRVIKYKGNYIVLSIYPIINIDNIKSCIVLIKEFTDTEKQQHNLRKQILAKGHKAKYNFCDIIGQSSAINYAKETAEKMALSDSSILICGESGTGKELFAQAIHNSSKRKDYQFIAVNCGAIPENLLESELFGYNEGAFTGAKKGGKLGYFELAHQGTLFLDEISELALSLQSRLLRVLQEKEVVRIGGDNVISVDVRIIAATNNDLKELVKEKKFRKDLYYRLNVLPLNIPPLRHRKEDIPMLIQFLKKQMNADFQLTDEVLNKIYKYDWEGNVRELRNFVERLMYIGKRQINSTDINSFLPEHTVITFLNDSEKHLLQSFRRSIWGNESKYLFIMEELEKSFMNKYRLGRRSISKIAAEKNIYLTEQEIRNIILDLKLYRVVEVSRGRGGTEITDFGLKALKAIRNNEADDDHIQ
ncbi:sigma-54 interaction domain-containing protein [Lutispora saccharofermentans]|uniref:Sigma 54-interacting transcriptional regulator n=1 Tax=Lutispora saccharofermentans TaxID=3024236 RepID=A0ABT1NLV1_9FIRM|nr:sigma 54-interacting transcriptional regulator [Lutispora saccharofermentans]MCQ1531276.1 sigma 54-interacting transcriptional regulator [Lutispora saccharofermentans]